MIFQVHLSKLRPETWTKYNINLLSRETNDFSGAEIRQVIIEAMHTAFFDKREFSTEDISYAIKQIIPLAHIDPDRTDIVQEWAYSGRIRIA
jgi:ATP-dependent 26S proteasome regulatory subunit